jgi:hypothetical protein
VDPTGHDAATLNLPSMLLAVGILAMLSTALVTTRPQIVTVPRVDVDWRTIDEVVDDMLDDVEDIGEIDWDDAFKAERTVPQGGPRPYQFPDPWLAPVPERQRREPQRQYLTYTKDRIAFFDDYGIARTYAGRTSGYGDDPNRILKVYDLYHPKNKEHYQDAILDKSLQATLPYGARHDDPSYQAIRGREQQWIDSKRGAWSDNGWDPSRTDSGNKIRGVAKSNALGRVYHDAANARFGELHSYTGY